jgi:O-antigen ligase
MTLSAHKQRGDRAVAAVASDKPTIAQAPHDQQIRLIVVGAAVIALLLGVLLGKSQNIYVYFVLAGAIVTVWFLVTRQDELIGGITVATVILIDYYQVVSLPIYFPAVATLLAGLAILIFYGRQSREHPWTQAPYLWIWALVLLLAALEIPVAESLGNAVRYYVTVLVNMPLAYTLGVQIGRSTQRLRRLLVALGVLASLIALHGIIQARTGTFLFLVPQWISALASKGNFTLSGTDKIRAGSFLINPDSLGAYLGVMLPVLLGLGVSLKASWTRIAAFIGAALVAVALLFTYSTTAWLATAVGLFATFLFVARGWARLYLPAICFMLAAVLGILFPTSVQVLLAHATDPGELSLRVGAWQTGLNVIAHNPLTGIGLGYTNYQDRSSLYRSGLQTIVLNHPHNSYLELAAMGGVPVAVFYLLVLGLCATAASKNYLRARGNDRVLIGAVLVSLIVLTVSSLATPGWTDPIIGWLGWLMVGAASSPALLSLPSASGVEAETAEPAARAERALATLATREEVP